MPTEGDSKFGNVALKIQWSWIVLKGSLHEVEQGLLGFGEMVVKS